MNSILVIEDDIQFRNLLRQVLERAGYVVIEASNGKEAVKHFREAPSDLVITDLIMPEQDGIETILELRRDFPDVKVIAISGGGRVSPDSYLLMASSLGAKRIISKPFEHRQILEAVEELLTTPPIVSNH